VVAGALPVADDGAQVGAVLPGQGGGVRRVGRGRVEHVLGEHPGLDALGQVDLLLGREQCGLADAVEVHADEVGRGALRVEVLGGHLGALDGLDLVAVRRRAPRSPTGAPVGAGTLAGNGGRAGDGRCGHVVFLPCATPAAARAWVLSRRPPGFSWG
jgi:hypothetical protein